MLWPFSKSKPAKPSRESVIASRYRSLKAKYDAAQTTEDNYKHWLAADSLSSVSANSQNVRRTLRSRSRYEVANNCYARGILNTLAAYMVGDGPSLQLNYIGEGEQPEAEIAQRVETLYAQWAKKRRLNQKLLTSCLALDQDGEAFAEFTNARASLDMPVQLDVRLREADWFDDPEATWDGDDSGVRTDPSGNPTAYSRLRAHPGDADSIADLTADWIPADRIIHLFRRERPGQLRGIPRVTPALPLFALFRRFTLATITAAETAADFAAILYGENPADTEDPEAAEAWDRIEIERGAMLTAPGGSRLAQLKAEHPNATYEEFTRAILREIARCLSCPAVVALGDSSNYNYASGRLDLQGFMRQLAVDRSLILEPEMLDRVFGEWLDEALLIEGYLPDEFNAADWSASWRWSQPEHVDRAKEATGQQTELANNTTTLAREYARKGLDWESEIRQRAREQRLLTELGITSEQAQPTEPGDADGSQEAIEETAGA